MATTWERFACWGNLIAHLDAHSDMVHYIAPLDRHPVPIVVVKRFKNGKLRCNYHDIKWTADASHLERFRFKADSEDWVLFTKRTNDPKLSWLERRLEETGIECQRNGESFHAPILEVRRHSLSAAWGILTPAVDAMDDDDPAFSKFNL